MSSSCEDFLDYIESVIPQSSIESRTKAGLMLMHLITLMRAYEGRVDLEHVRSRSGKPFVAEIMRHSRLVYRLVSGLKLPLDLCWDTDQIPEWLKQKAKESRVDVTAVRARHRKLEKANYEISVLSLFVQIARTVMQNVHQDTLRALDRGYFGHCHPTYARKKWLLVEGKGDRSLMGLRALDLPSAKASQAPVSKPAAPSVALKPRTAPSSVIPGRHGPGPVPAINKAPRAAQSSSSSTCHPAGRKLGPTPTPTSTRPNPYPSPLYGPASQLPSAQGAPFYAQRTAAPTPTAAQFQAVQYAQYAACVAYQQAMWQAAAQRH